MKCVCPSPSHVWLLVTPWTVAHQAPVSMGFSRQEYWTGLPFPSPGDLPNPGIKPGSPALRTDFLLSEPPRKPQVPIKSEYIRDAWNIDLWLISSTLYLIILVLPGFVCTETLSCCFPCPPLYRGVRWVRSMGNWVPPASFPDVHVSWPWLIVIQESTSRSLERGKKQRGSQPYSFLCITGGISN